MNKKEIASLAKDFKDVYCTFPIGEVSNDFAQSLNFVTYIYTDEKFEYKEKSYVYDLGDNKIKRISNFNGKCVYEYIGFLTQNEARKVVKENVNILDLVVLETTISKGNKVDWYNGMKMVGRFATNDHSQRIDTIIEKFLGG